MWTSDEKLLLGGLGAIGLLLWGPIIKDKVVDVVGRGARLTYGDVVGGVVQDDPDDLVAAASAVMGRPISRDVYALAKMARSEGIKAGELRVHVALNDLADLNNRRGFGWSPFDLIAYSTDDAARGSFGEQLHRRYASDEDPYQGDVVLVEKAMADHAAGRDLTDGALKFVDKSSFGVQAGTGSYAATVDSWANEGLSPFYVAGQSTDFVVFRRV